MDFTAFITSVTNTMNAIGNTPVNTNCWGVVFILMSGLVIGLAAGKRGRY